MLFTVEPWASVTRGTAVITVPNVRTPFPNVPDHVVQSPRVRALQAHRLRAIPAVDVEPGIVAQDLPDLPWDFAGVKERTPRPKEVLSRGARPARVFPFRLRWEANGTATLSS